MGIIHYFIIGAVIITILIFQIKSCLETRRKTQELDRVFSSAYNITQKQINVEVEDVEPRFPEPSTSDIVIGTPEELGKRLQGKKLAFHNYRSKLSSIKLNPGDYYGKREDIERYENKIIALGNEIEILEKRIKDFDKNEE